MINEKSLYIEIGKNVRRMRDLNNLSQTQLADRIGLERTSVTNIEQGKQKVTIAVLVKMCLIFDVSITDLLPGLDTFIEQNVSKEIEGSNIWGDKTNETIEKYKKKISH